MNNYVLWMNGLQGVDIMDKFVELHLYINDYTNGSK